MSSLIAARDLSKSYPSNHLFDGLSINVAPDDRLGLIGPNGAGKSTLMKILAGVEDADEGEIVRRRGANLVYVPQDDQFPADATPLSAVESALTLHPAQDLDVRTRASITLSKLGFEDFERPVGTLSGGWRKRLSLACALCHDPDGLMLDEPTNHLDLEGVLWLESFLRQSSLAVVVVTHDRTFLESVATRIIEISAAYPGGTFEARGNYSEFLRRKDAFLNAQASAQSALANKVRRDTAWLRQGIQGRQTRNKTQVDAAADRREELRDTKHRNRAPSRTADIDFQATERKTKKLIALHNVGKSMGEKRLFEGINLILSPGQRLGLLGVNGAGKTTLLRLMSGDLEPDTGSVKRAAELRTVTFSQHRGTLVPTETLQQALCPVGDTVHYRDKPIHVSGWARRFLFDVDQLSTPIRLLSGGEQARVLIANLMLKPADVLLLDEPTNDLDIPSLEVLEQALLEFPGAIVLVTHDRFMLERIATEYVGLDDQGGAKLFTSYERWNQERLDRQAAAREAARPKSKAREKPRERSSSGRLTYKLQREYDGMEEAILEAEAAVERLESEAADPALAEDHVLASKRYAALAEAHEEVRRLYDRWAELEAMQSA